MSQMSSTRVCNLGRELARAKHKFELGIPECPSLARRLQHYRGVSPLLREFVEYLNGTGMESLTGEPRPIKLKVITRLVTESMNNQL